MLTLTKYSNALYLFIVACAVLFSTTVNVFFSNADTATRVGGIIGVVGVGVVMALPYFFSFRAARTRAADHVKQAMVASTIFLALSAPIAIFGAFGDLMVSFGAVLWSLPAIFAVNTFKSWPTSHTPNMPVEADAK